MKSIAEENAEAERQRGFNIPMRWGLCAVPKYNYKSKMIHTQVKSVKSKMIHF